jgi:hypothetical protein
MNKSTKRYEKVFNKSMNSILSGKGAGNFRPIIRVKKQSGVQGTWIRIQPEHEQSFIPQPDSLIVVGVILGAGSKSIYKNNIGDKVVVRDWMVERPTVYDEVRFYTTDENVLDIL